MTSLARIIGLYRRNPASLSIPLLLNVHSELGDRIIATLDSLLRRYHDRGGHIHHR